MTEYLNGDMISSLFMILSIFVLRNKTWGIMIDLYLFLVIINYITINFDYMSLLVQFVED